MSDTIDLSGTPFVFTRHARERMAQFHYEIHDFIQDSKAAIYSLEKDGAKSYQIGHYIVVLKDEIHKKFNSPCRIVITVYDRQFDLGGRASRGIRSRTFMEETRNV